LALFTLVFLFGFSAFFSRLPWERVRKKVLKLQMTQTMAERLTMFSRGFLFFKCLKFEAAGSSGGLLPFQSRWRRRRAT
jgi:hypothetical protein